MAKVPIGPDVIADARKRQKAKKPGAYTALDYIVANAAHQGDGCLIWPFSRFPTGYGKVGVAGTVMFAHRVMCAAAHGAPPSESHETAHSCGNGHAGCINPNHLRWATHIENISDKFAHGTVIGGGEHYRAKLTSDQVLQIRSADLSKRGAKVRLARSFGVSHSAIHRIRSGASYREVF